MMIHLYVVKEDWKCFTSEWAERKLTDAFPNDEIRIWRAED